MANKTISMSKIRQIIKLYSQRMGKKRIGTRLSISKNTVKLYIDAYHRLQRPWDELSLLTDFELNKLFNPVKEVISTNKLQDVFDFFPAMEKQLRKRGMTIAIQYRKFLEEHPDTYKESRFYFYYRQYCKRSKSSMHIEHTPGDKAYIDFAGVNLPYVDTDTGEIKQAEIFVAILGWSQFAYVEAMLSQSNEEFITACENALLYFDGVPSALVPDNLKAAVIKTDKYEPHLNDNFKSFAKGTVFHFNLKCITHKFNFIQIYVLKHFFFVANKSGCCIMNFHSGNNININRSKIGQKNSTQRPVNNVYTSNIARTNCHIGTSIRTSFKQFF